MGSGQGFWTLLSPDEQNSLSLLGLRRDYPAGATLCHEGDPATHVFILLTGWVKVLSTTKDGHEIVLALRGDGDIVGEIGAETTRRTATIRAIGKVPALLVQFDRFYSFLDTNLGAGHAYRRIVTLRWNDESATLRGRTGTSGAQRLGRLLLDLGERHGREVDRTIHVAMPLSQEELASLAGTSRATVTRAFRNWRERGLIRTATRQITILDPKGLRKAAGLQQ